MLAAVPNEMASRHAHTQFNALPNRGQPFFTSASISMTEGLGAWKRARENYMHKHASQHLDYEN